MSSQSTLKFVERNPELIEAVAGSSILHHCYGFIRNANGTYHVYADKITVKPVYSSEEKVYVGFHTDLHEAKLMLFNFIKSKDNGLNGNFRSYGGREPWRAPTKAERDVGVMDQVIPGSDGVTVQELLDAFHDLLDGTKDHDVAGMTGEGEHVERIIKVRRATSGHWTVNKK